MKKIISFVLSLIMFLSVTAGLDFSVYAETYEDLTYKVLDDGTAQVTGYINEPKELNIPSIIDGYIVTSVGNRAFYFCHSLTEIIIPDSVTSIGSDAFSDCLSLRNIIIGNNVTSIGSYAFSGCSSLISVTIPDSITSIGKKVFSGCTSLTSITIPNSVTSIGDDAFEYCWSLTSIKIPNSVTSIGDRVFFNCSRLTDVTIPNSVTCIGKGTFSDCSSLTSVTIPNSVTSIGERAFYNCKSLTSITIPNSVTNIVYEAFYGCLSLKDVYYLGSKQEWNSISIGNSNSDLINAKIHYNFISPCDVHTPLSAVKENVIKATCTTEGAYDSVVYCSVCKREISRTKKTTKIAHTYKTYTTKATTSKNGSVVTKCTVCGAVKSKSTINYAKTVSISKRNYTYDGKYKKPTVIVKDSKGNKISNTNYSVTYSNNKYVGKANVKVKFKGNYSGNKTLSFTITPKTVTILDIKAKSKGFTVKWKKQSTQTTGYQVQYSTNKNFKNAKTITIKKNKTTSRTVSKLKAKKKYYVRVRTYKIVNGTKYYSSWSKAKTVTTKK